jgi:hypothetical protein
MIEDYLAQNNLFELLQDEGWSNGEMAIKLNNEILAKIELYGLRYDQEYSRAEFDSCFNSHDEQIQIEIYHLLNLKKACERAIGMRILAAEKATITKAQAFAGGADSTAIIIYALLKSYRTAAELSADEIYNLMRSKTQSEKALGVMLEPKKYVMSKSSELLARVGENGYNPSYREVADYLQGVLMDKFGIDGVPELDTLISWVKQCKPVDHNPKLGKKPQGYRSVFDS